MSSVKQVETIPNQSRIISITFTLSQFTQSLLIFGTPNAIKNICDPKIPIPLHPAHIFSESQTEHKPIIKIGKKKKKKGTMSLENAKDLASVDTPHLSNTMRVTKNHTDLRRCQTFLRKLANVFLNLKTQQPNSIIITS
jgi:hypothetical protein